MYQMPAQPRSIGQVLDDSFKLFKGSFKQMFGLALLYSALISVPSFLQSLMLDASEVPSLGNVGWIMLVSLALVFVSIPIYGAMMHRMDALARGDAAAAERSLSVGLGSWGRFVLAAILYLLAVVIGSVLLLIPGIILMLSLVMVWPLIVLENGRVIASLRRSHSLVWGNWWRVAVIFTVVAIIYMVPLFLAGVVIGAGAAVSGDAGGLGLNLGMDVFMLLVQAVITPFMIAAMLCVFYDLKLRKEGLDLEAKLAPVGA